MCHTISMKAQPCKGYPFQHPTPFEQLQLLKNVEKCKLKCNSVSDPLLKHNTNNSLHSLASYVCMWVRSRKFFTVEKHHP